MRPELRQAYKPALRADGLDQLVALISRVLLQSARQDMREAWRLALRGERDNVRAGLGPDVAQIAGDPDARHLGNDFAPKARQARIVELGVACAGIVLGVVADGKEGVSGS